MVAASKLIEDALREPMKAIGWTPRAAGWFTMPIAPSKLGVIATSTASEHTAPGTGMATLHVHLRDEDVERVVADVCEVNDHSYRTTTAATSIGYLMSAQAWQEWYVAPHMAEFVAAEMAAATRDYATPFLDRLAADPQHLLNAVMRSPAYAQSTGVCREVILLARMGNRTGASESLDRHLSALQSRTDAAAVELRRAAAAVQAWLHTAAV